MSSIADQIGHATRINVPEQWRAQSTWDGQQGQVTTGPIAPTENFDDLLKKFDYDPDKFEIVGKVNQWRKETPDGNFLVSYFFGVRAKESVLDLPALFATARRKPRARVKAAPKPITEVAALADVQAGKVDRNGGTPELIERLEGVKEKLHERFKRTKPERIVIPDVGDLFEGFESGGNPMFTNDMSLAEQMDFAATVIYDFVELAHKYAPVDIVPVPSNHTAWRRSAQNLGRPSDDLGLHVHRNVQRVAAAAGLDATWHYPAPYDEHVTIDVRGTRLGVVHGNQYSPGGAPLWWAKQQHGGQAIGSADILLGGHYHNVNIQPTGRNPYTAKAKWFLQCPSLDGGSSWYTTRAGEDSDPGMLVFSVTDDGFDLQSLAVL